MANMHSDDHLTGLVFNIQRFSLDDGPGIRTTVFLKGCPLSCRWCQNPESLRPQPEIAFRREQCLDCRACVHACPQGAIALSNAYRIDPARCNACGACVEACPSGALFAIGQRYTVTELLTEVQRDAAFYRISGGGVTASGGEPMMQFEFLRAFLQACKEAGLDTAIETNGFSSQDKYAVLLPLLDRIYYDLKVITPLDHRRLTGVDNTHILENARWLVKAGARVIFRVPLVPGMTATEDNVHALGGFLKEIGVVEVELCPYQDGWEKKLAWVHTSQHPLGLLPPSSVQMLAVVTAFAGQGIRAEATNLLAQRSSDLAGLRQN